MNLNLGSFSGGVVEMGYIGAYAGVPIINSINENNTGDQYKQVTAVVNGFVGDITNFTVGASVGVVIDGSIASGTVSLRLPGDLATGSYTATLSNQTETATITFAYTKTHSWTSPYMLVDSDSAFSEQLLTDNSFHRISVPFANGTLDAAAVEAAGEWGFALTDIYTPDGGFSGTDTATFEILYDNGTVASWSVGAVIADDFASKVTSVDLPADATYTLGQTLSLTVNWDEIVNVTGLPAININLDGVNRKARYASGTGTATTVFTYTIQQYDNASSGIALTSLTLDNGTIQDVDLNNASLVLNGVGPTAGVLVDTGPDALVVIDSKVIDRTNATINFSYPGTDVTGFEYNLDGGAWITLTDPAQLTELAAQTFYTFTTRPLNANGPGKTTSTTFTTGDAIDVSPNPFSFATLINQSLNTFVVSNAITVSDVDAGVDIPASVVNGSYAVSTDGGVNWGGVTSSPTNVRLGYQIRVSHDSSAQYSNTVDGGSVVTELTVGNQLATFVSTTIEDLVAPVIYLAGGTVELLQGVDFVEPGFIAKDTTDVVLTDSVDVIGLIDPNLTVPQTLEYRVEDASGNVGFAYRTVIYTVPATNYEFTEVAPTVRTHICSRSINKQSSIGIFLLREAEELDFDFDMTDWLLEETDSLSTNAPIVELVGSGVTLLDSNIVTGTSRIKVWVRGDIASTNQQSAGIYLTVTTSGNRVAVFQIQLFVVGSY
jgi:hypothetical protein